MPLVDNAWYANYGNGTNTGYFALPQWAATTAYTAGQTRRQLATPTVFLERVFVCIIAGTSGGSEPAWVVTRGAKTTDGTVTWQECSGVAALNGDAVSTPSWDAFKAITSAGLLGQVIKNNAGTHYFIMTTAGTIGASQPAFNTTTGGTTTDNTAVWTCIGAVGAFIKWANPACRSVNAAQSNWCQAGNTIWVASGQLETSPNTMTYTFGGIETNPCYMFCVTPAGSVPPVAADLRTDAEIATTGNSVITFNSAVYIYGFIIHGGKTGAISGGGLSFGGTGDCTQIIDNCTLRCSGTGAMQMVFGAALVGNRTLLNNTTVAFASVSGSLNISGDFYWQNTPNAVQGSAFSTNFMTLTGGGRASSVFCQGVDFSALGAGKILVTNGSANANVCRWIFLDCIINAAVTRYGTPLSVGGMQPEFIRCGSSAGSHQDERVRFNGTLTYDTTVVRTGGASDGTTGVSQKVITNANSKWQIPFECAPLVVFNATVGSPITLTVEGVWNTGPVPNNDEVWMMVEYLGSNSTMMGSFDMGTKATPISANAAQSASGAVWSGGLSTPFKMAATITPQQAGYIYVYVRVAKASTTVYIDPKVTII